LFQPFLAHAVSRLDSSAGDGIHLLWSAPTGYSIKGFDIQRRPSAGGPKYTCHTVTDNEWDELDRTYRVRTPLALLSKRTAPCPHYPGGVQDQPYDDHHHGHPPDSTEHADKRPGQKGYPPNPFHLELRKAAPSKPAAPVGVLPTLKYLCLRYDVDFGGSFQLVSLVMGTKVALVVAMRADKAVHSALLKDAGGTQSYVVRGRQVDRVIIYSVTELRSLTYCRDLMTGHPFADDTWERVPYIRRGLQLPFRNVNSFLQNEFDELNLAKSRLLPGETLDGDFGKLATICNEAADEPNVRAPWRASRFTRNNPKENFVEFLSWPLALSLGLDPSTRRVLGLAYLDNDPALVPGRSYDYRITGHFRKSDLKERYLGFHTVPDGTKLPREFHLADVCITSSGRLTVTAYPKLDQSKDEQTARKGVWITRPLRLHFVEAISVLTLEVEASTVQGLAYSADTSDFFSGLSVTPLSGQLPRRDRITIEFTAPVHHVTLTGRAFLFGIRHPSLPPDVDPNELVSLSAVVPGVVFENSPLPAPPELLWTRHLQQIFSRRSRHNDPPAPLSELGFRVHWLPGLSDGSTQGLWPEELAASPPFDGADFMIERRRVDVPGNWQPVARNDDESAPEKQTRFFGNRGHQFETVPLRYGADLLELYPEESAPTAPVPLFMTIDDNLRSMADDTGPPPSSLHQYRIWALDVIGRKSATATVGSVVRLEKHLPPPQPTSPPPVEVSPQNIQPTGVRVRFLQQSDPDLSEDDQSLLDGHSNAIWLEWGWMDKQRAMDKYATEFRVYLQSDPPDFVRGQLTGSAVESGTNLQMNATMSHPVIADEMAGVKILSEGQAFEIVSHTATDSSLSTQLTLTKPERDPSARLAASSFTHLRTLDGEEMRPLFWEKRAAFYPIDEKEHYEHVFFDTVVLSGSNPRARLWVGVSSADDQAYVPDELPPSRSNGNRPGNESSIVGLSVDCKYIGQPIFEPPLPLEDVPETVLDEPVGDRVAAVVEVPAELHPMTGLPAGHRMLVERLPLSGIMPMISATDDDKIRATLAKRDGTVFADEYILAPDKDQASFLAAIRSGEPARVATKFILDFLKRYEAHRDVFDEVWQGAFDGPRDWGRITDSVPSQADRFLYRIRLVDAAGHVSAKGQILSRVYRVPSLRVPGFPQIKIIAATDSTIDVRIAINEAYDAKWVLLFTVFFDLAEPLDQDLIRKPQLLRVPNRRDLYPLNGIRVRLRDGRMVGPTAVTMTDGTAVNRRYEVVHSLAAAPDKRAVIWAAQVTRDGIPSRLMGPVIGTTGPPVPVPPLLSVVTQGNEDTCSWSVAESATAYAVERSTDNGASWLRVTPWLAPHLGQYVLVGSPAAARLYRLVVKGARGAMAAGQPVAPA